MTHRNKGKSNRNQRMKTIQKDTRSQRSASKSIASPAIHSVQRIVQLLKPYELSNTNRFETYQLMIGDEAVWSSVESRMTSIEVAQANFKLKYDKNSERSVFLKEFIEHNLRGMARTMRAVGRECGEMVYNGIALHEPTASVEKSGEYVGLFTLDDIIYIDPLTIDTIRPYETEEGGRKLKYWRQKKSAFVDTSNQLTLRQAQQFSQTGAVRIDSRKVGVSAYAASQSRPMGTSALDAAYTPWKEKNLIQEYLLVGIQKDLAGTPVLRVPVDLFEKAKEANSDAAATLAQLQEHMANLHAGDQTFMILPSDAFNDAGSGALQYDVDFKGISGTGKNFDLVSIIEQKKKAIYNVLGASHLITGENGGGSLNMLEGQVGIQAHYSNRDNMIVDDMMNKTVIPFILMLNGMNDEKTKDIPQYCHGDVQPLSVDEVSKALQRTGAVGLLPKNDPIFLNEAYEKMGFLYRFDEKLSPEEVSKLTGEETSRSGDGMRSGMSNGVGDATGGGDTSTTNSENAV